MALHWCQNFVSAQYLQNKLMIVWYCDMPLLVNLLQLWLCFNDIRMLFMLHIIFVKQEQSYCPWLPSVFGIHLISWEIWIWHITDSLFWGYALHAYYHFSLASQMTVFFVSEVWCVTSKRGAGKGRHVHRPGLCTRKLRFRTNVSHVKMKNFSTRHLRNSMRTPQVHWKMSLGPDSLGQNSAYHMCYFGVDRVWLVVGALSWALKSSSGNKVCGTYHLCICHRYFSVFGLQVSLKKSGAIWVPCCKRLLVSDQFWSSTSFGHISFKTFVA